VLVEFVKTMAPFLPFLAEEVYRNLVVGKIDGVPESVHLASYPSARTGLIDNDLELTMRLVREAVAVGRALRSTYAIKTRQPLAECTVIMRDAGKLGLLKKSETLIREELNVKRVAFDTDEEHVVSISAKANFRILGKVLGPKMKEAAAAIEKFTVEQIHALERGETITVSGHPVAFGDIEIRRTKREHIEVGTGSEMTVALDTAITPELKNEGLAREFVNRVQNMRKDAGLEVSDRIRAVYESDNKELTEALERFSDYIKSETLSLDLSSGKMADDSKSEKCEIEGIPVVIAIDKIT
ncbi:MAG: class I tRNA ligase family protein, partial [Chitinispirillaceae bacterium]|nr:class I tRNA ligase family protein [Chitinispirillaceae bacterium]